MTEREIIINTMVVEFSNNSSMYPNGYELAVYAAEMHELWEDDEVPAWLEAEAEDIFGGNY